MREDNHDKRMFYKLIFLMVVSLLIVIVYIWKWTADDTKEQKPEEMFQENEQQEATDKPDGLDEDKINDVLTGEDVEARKTDTEDESDENEGTENNQGEADLEQSYMNQYSEQEVEQAKEQAEKVLALYLLQVTDWDKWEGAVTSDYLDNMKNEMTNFKDKKAKRKLDSIELLDSKQ